MIYSKDGLHLTEQFEGCKLQAYYDPRGGLWTIGYGHTRGVVAGMVCTKDQAEAWLAQDIAWAASEVNRLAHVPLTQPEFDALTDFTFNCGCGNFDHSTLLRLVNSGYLTLADAEFEKWDKAGGEVIGGLLRRRKAEALEFSEK